MISQKMNCSVVRFQDNAPLAITGAIRGTSQENQYQELGYLLFLQTNYNSEAIISFQSDTSKT